MATDGLADLGAALHDPQTQRDDLRGQEEVDHLLLVRLDQGADHAEGGEPQVLGGPRLAHCIEEEIQTQSSPGPL